MQSKNGTKNMEIVQGNCLIEGAYKVGMDEMRLLHLALTHVDTKDVFNPTPYVITTKAFSEMFNIPLQNAYFRLKGAVENLLVSPITLYEPQANGKIRKIKFPWFSRLSYIVEDNAEVEIVFNEHICPHLYELQQNFTKVPFDNIAKLDQPFAIRLYSWLNRYRLLDSYKSNTGVRVEFKLEWLKERAGLVKVYNDYKDFKKRMIDPAVDKINAVTDISVSYEPIRQGRKIIGLEFFFIEQQLTEKACIPLRPRLPRRPHVLKGSDAEGKWARQGIKLLLEYKAKLAQVDKKLTLADMRRLKDYFEILGDSFAANDVQQAIESRQNKQLKKSA